MTLISYFISVSPHFYRVTLYIYLNILLKTFLPLENHAEKWYTVKDKNNGFQQLAHILFTWFST